MTVSPRKLAFSDIQIGDAATIEQHLSVEMVDRFADLSGDHSPIHVNEAAARARGFQKRVVHGFLTGALVSQVLGMLLPGEYGLLHDVYLQFKKPVYVDDRVKITIIVNEKNDTFHLLKLDVTVTNQDGALVCKGKVTSSISQ